MTFLWVEGMGRALAVDWGRRRSGSYRGLRSLSPLRGWLPLTSFTHGLRRGLHSFAALRLWLTPTARPIFALIRAKSRESTLAVAKLLTLCYSFKLPWLGSSLYKCLTLSDLCRNGSRVARIGPYCPVEILWKT